MTVPPRRRPAAAALAAVLIASAVTASTVLTSAAEAANPIAATPPTRSGAAAARPIMTYVALGDSYTAGPLIPETTGLPAGCVRSNHNYPAYLAQWLKVSPLSFHDVSCSAADTTNMRHPQSTPAGTNPPQFDALTPSTDLVTLGIGGNDFGVFGDIIATCPKLRHTDPHGAPCRRHFTVDGVDTMRAKVQRTQRRVGAVIRGIHQRSPHARVLVVGYIRIAPPTGVCPKVLPFADGDYRWANGIEVALNSALRSASQQHRARFLNMYPASLGHDACKGSRAWVNGKDVQPTRAYDYHPFQSGMLGIARTAYRSITGHRAPPPGPLG
ncbi:MAG: SGNH/GDSL hydrolase family protein [Nocardioidaceae bacterium]